ncbi:ABC transporter ATP-binding protein [Desulfonauticus submarinus]
MASIRLKNIYKKFGNTEILHDVDMHIEDGEFIVFVGPSGCGKTTLLRIIAGLETQSKGNVYINDKIVDHLSPKDRNIAMVFQNYALYPHMTVEQNIVFGLKLRKLSKKEQKKAVSEVADMLGLAEFLNRKPRDLSGGQRQRVAMARAIVRHPNVFLMDEPLSNLDAKLRNQMRINIKKLQRRLRTTTIYVTHDQLEAMAMADRIVVFHNGRIVQYGTPEKIYYKPANIFVADFIGNMNFFSVTRIADNKFKLTDDIVFTLPEKIAFSLVSREYIVGIRPERIYIVSNETIPMDFMVYWNSKVLFNEIIGGESLLHATLYDNEIIVKVTEKEVIHEGSIVRLGFSSKDVHFFDMNTGVCVSHALL